MARKGIQSPRKSLAQLAGPILFLVWSATAGSAWAFPHQFWVLFDYTHPNDPAVYYSSDPAADPGFPEGAKGDLGLTVADYQKTIQDRFRKARHIGRFVTEVQKNSTLEVYVVLPNASLASSTVIQDMREESMEVKYTAAVGPLPGPLAPVATVSGVGENDYFVHKSFPLQFMRSCANLTVSVGGRPSSAQVLIGPQDDIFLGADLPVHYFDQNFQKLPLSQQPQEFYLSLNYMPFGDHYLEDLQPIVHFFAKVSPSPFDSIGIGLGVRLPNFWLVMDLSNVTVSLNLLRTQGNGVESYEWVCQAGYNLFALFPGLYH